MTIVKVKLQNIKTETEKTIEFLVDTGAAYTAVSQADWNELGLKADGKVKVRTATGEVLIVEKTGVKYFWEKAFGTADIIKLPKISRPLLGVTALEAMNVVVNPNTEKLVAEEVALLMRLK